MAAKSFRLQFKFWLDVTKDVECEIAGQIEELKAKRSYTKVVRDGIRLVYDLKQGRVGVLRELFPWVFDTVAGVLEEERVARESAIEAKLARLESLMLSQHEMPKLSGPKPMKVPTFDVSEDDDFVDLEIRKDASADSTQNFVNSVRALSG